MNSTRYNERSTQYSRLAGETRSRRAKAGLYQTPSQKAAFSKRMREGEGSLSKAELELLATDPYLGQSQRAHYQQLADAA